MYAIIVTGGKQYRVEQGDIVYIEKLDVEADSEVKFDQSLARMIISATTSRSTLFRSMSLT